MANDDSDSGETTYLLSSGDNTARAGGWRTGICFVLCSVILERTAYYSLIGSIVSFLMKEPLCWTLQDSSQVNAVISGAAHFLCLPSAIVADAYSMRVAVAAGYAAYFLGYSLATVHGFATDGVNVTLRNEGTSCKSENFSFSFVCSPGQRQPCMLSVYAACVLVGLATSLLRASIPPFGADQVRTQGLAVTRSILAWYYWAANVGGALAYLIMTYLQKHVGYGSGFASPFLLVMISGLIFYSGSHKYCWRPANHAAIKNFWGIIKVAIKAGFGCNRHDYGKGLGCFEYAKVINGGEYTSTAVEQVKAGGRVCAALILMMPCWVLFSRMMATFWEEGLHMSQTGVRGQAEIAQVFNYVGVAVALPLCNMVLYPLAGRYGYRMTMYNRFIVGMLAGIVCLIVAGVVDVVRINHLDTGGSEIIGYTRYNVSSVNILSQIPQNFLLGASQACTTVTAMEFTYVAAPRSMQCLLMAVFWVVFGIADVINLTLLPGVPYSVVPAVQQKYHLTYFYFMVAAVLCGVAAAIAVAGKVFDIGLDALTVAASRPLPRLPRHGYLAERNVPVLAT